VVGCVAPAAAKLALNTKVLWLGRLGLKSKVTPSQLGQDQLLLALFIDYSALYSRLIQSLVWKPTNRSDLLPLRGTN
jgi:hypothetical protein